MKTRKYFFVVILLLLILVSCHQSDTLGVQSNIETMNNQDSDDESREESIVVKYNYTIKGNTADEFLSLISENPIDLKYEELYEDYDGSSSMIRVINFKYKEFWYREMEVAYNQLLNLLDEKDRQSLIDSQIAWESYMENKSQIEDSFFFQQKYDSLGTLRTALTFYESAEETKKRAYSILEYLYIITGEINMVFSSEEW